MKEKTQFHKDMDTFISNKHKRIKETICYFFGHKWAEWKKGSTEYKAFRTCSRCKENEYGYK